VTGDSVKDQEWIFLDPLRWNHGSSRPFIGRELFYL